MSLEELIQHLSELITDRPELASAEVWAGNPNGKHAAAVVDTHIPRTMRTVVLGTNGSQLHFVDAIY